MEWISTKKKTHLVLAFHTYIPFSIPPSIMTGRPTRKVVTARPSTDKLNGNVRRRSSEQVKKDVQTKKAATAAAERSIDATKRRKQAHIANLEDNLRKEDVLWEKQSVRPDLLELSSESTGKPNKMNAKVSALFCQVRNY
jgi:hypothetical protein